VLNVARLSKRSRTMRASMAYLGGAGTVIVAIAMGLGGGLLMGNIMNPHEVREIGKVEQRRAGPQQAEQSPQPASDQNKAATTTATNGPQTQSPYVAATQQAATAPVVVSPAPANPPQSNAPQTEATNAAPQAPQPAAPAAQPAAPAAEKADKTASND